MNEYIELMERTLSAWVKEYPVEWIEQAYKDTVGETTTKNDLGVDCISRTSALDSINWAYNLGDAYQKINDLPSVTPQQRKGHWVLTDVEGYRVWHCNCSECGKDPQDYIGGSEDW